MIGVRVVFEDDDLIILEKPPGLVVTSSETQKEPSLEDILRLEHHITLDRGGVVHRLDKDTSGLLVVAKTQTVLENIQQQFKERSIEKNYLALVHGYMNEPGKIAGLIGRNPGDREKFIVFDEEEIREDANVREAITEYRPINKFQISNLEYFNGVNSLFHNKIQMRKIERQSYGQFTLLNVHPLTGRTHQIRVHLKYTGHPIVGDEKYAGRKTAKLDKRWVPRQFLHAANMAFNHPVTGERMNFESPLPDDLKKVLSKLERV